MNKSIFFLVALIAFFSTSAQQHTQDIEAHRQNLNQEFKDPEQSPLTEEDLEHFEGLAFFDIDKAYAVEATFVKKKGKKFEMPTSGQRTPVYRKEGELHFQLFGKPYQLSVYRNIDLSKKEEYKDYLFIPFKDYTNGVESYGGGRYLDLQMPKKGEPWLLDFNKAYNPYCAYSDRWSCPIPPEENHLKVEIRSGVRKFHD